MDKDLKKRAIDFFTQYLGESLPTFTSYREKSKYFFGSEKVWEDVTSVSAGYLYVIFCPEYKGRNQFTIEIGWSKLRRFPHVSRRPFLAFKSDFENCYIHQEATTRLSYITGATEWLDIDRDNVEAVIREQIRSLVEHGIPFLHGIAEPTAPSASV